MDARTLPEKQLESAQRVHSSTCGGRWPNYKGQVIVCEMLQGLKWA